MRRVSAGVVALGVLLATGACTENEAAPSQSGSDRRSIAVTASEEACELSATSAPAGTVSNDGAAVTEFYVLDAAGGRVLGEVENVGPGLSRDLVVELAKGSYTTACKPGMTGEGILSDFAVEAASG